MGASAPGTPQVLTNANGRACSCSATPCRERRIALRTRPPNNAARSAVQPRLRKNASGSGIAATAPGTRTTQYASSLTGCSWPKRQAWAVLAIASATRASGAVAVGELARATMIPSVSISTCSKWTGSQGRDTVLAWVIFMGGLLAGERASARGGSLAGRYPAEHETPVGVGFGRGCAVRRERVGAGVRGLSSGCGVGRCASGPARVRRQWRRCNAELALRWCEWRVFRAIRRSRPGQPLRSRRERSIGAWRLPASSGGGTPR